MASGELLNEEECRALLAEALAFSRADEAEATLSDEELTHLRFARNTAGTCARVRTRSVTVRSAFGSRSATARANQLDRVALEALVRRSEELAARAPEDPEFVPALGPQAFESAGETGTDEEEPFVLLVAGAQRCIAEARAGGHVAAGFVESTRTARAIATSAGLFGYHRAREAHCSETVRTGDGRGSGWASHAARRGTELDFARVSRTALDKAAASAGPRVLATGAYPAVLEADCVAQLARLLVQGMDARSADEGRSFFSRPGGATRQGEALCPDWVTLRSDPAHALLPTVPWDEGGTPQRATDWIRAGTVANLSCGRYWAAKSGRVPLPGPPNLLFEGGRGEAADLVRNLERGLLITSLWYVRAVDPRTLLYTGLTRDGVFWVEGGEIRQPLTNFRWNESPARVLANALEASAPQRVGGRGGDLRHCYVPALRVSAFTLTGVTDAV